MPEETSITDVEKGQDQETGIAREAGTGNTAERKRAVSSEDHFQAFPTGCSISNMFFLLIVFRSHDETGHADVLSRSEGVPLDTGRYSRWAEIKPRFYLNVAGAMPNAKGTEKGTQRRAKSKTTIEAWTLAVMNKKENKINFTLKRAHDGFLQTSSSCKQQSGALPIKLVGSGG